MFLTKAGIYGDMIYTDTKSMLKIINSIVINKPPLFKKVIPAIAKAAIAAKGEMKRKLADIGLAIKLTMAKIIKNGITVIFLIILLT